MYKLQLCLRYLRTRWIALASIISVMLGVATMIVVNSVMAGFSGEMRDRIHGLLADIVVESRSPNGISDAEKQMQTVRDAVGDYVEAMSPNVQILGMMTFNYGGGDYVVPVELIGIDPESKATVGELMEYLDSYKPVTRDGRIVREALRSSDVPPGWDLTDNAMEHRRVVKDRERWLLQQQGFHQNPPKPTASVPAVEHANAETTAGPKTAGPMPLDVPDFDDAEPADGGVQQVAAVENSFDNENPFAEVEDDPAESISDEPQDARLYVGHGLVTFPWTNPDSGEVETRYLVQPGDDVSISTVKAGRPDVLSFKATIVDTFQSGMAEYDSKFVFMNLKELQDNRGMFEEGPDGKRVRAITTIQIKLKDYDDAPTVVRRLEDEFPPDRVAISTWEMKQGPLLEAVAVESAILNVLLFLIIAVAGFGILAIFFMIVVEKTRDIGILKALGASSGGIMSIFLSYGLALGVVGSGVGVVLGLLFVRYINEIEEVLSWITGRKVFDEKIYYFFDIPTQVNPWMVASVAFGAMAIAVLASVLPARRAARLHPVEALRYE